MDAGEASPLALAEEDPFIPPPGVIVLADPGERPEAEDEDECVVDGGGGAK